MQGETFGAVGARHQRDAILLKQSGKFRFEKRSFPSRALAEMTAQAALGTGSRAEDVGQHEVVRGMALNLRRRRAGRYDNLAWRRPGWFKSSSRLTKVQESERAISRLMMG